MANSRLTVKISCELVFSISVIGNEKIQICIPPGNDAVKPFTEHSTVLLYNSFWGLGLFEPLNGTVKYDSMSITSVNKRMEYVLLAHALPAHPIVRSSFLTQKVSSPRVSVCTGHLRSIIYQGITKVFLA